MPVGTAEVLARAEQRVGPGLAAYNIHYGKTGWLPSFT